jgi:uncharacterized protein (TIGR02444 family)
MPEDAAHFIQFALRLYSREGIAKVCLRLQDECGLNVNCLLLAAWAARIGLAVDAELWAELLKHTAPIRDAAVQPIRRLRRQISKEVKLKEELRGPIKRLLLYAEVRAEQAEEHALHERLVYRGKPATPGEDLLRGNLRQYAGEHPLVERFAALVMESELLDEPRLA